MIYGPTPLVGRETEFADLRNKVLDPAVRMLTLTGPVGVGKSRLASALFENVSVEFAHGGRFLDLSSVDETHDLTAVFTAALGFSGDDGLLPAERLAAYLRDRHFLLVLDGCEHLLKDLVPLVTGLVSACTRLSVLVSSPAPMGAYGERLLRLAPLAFPASPLPRELSELERIPAVQLFVHRARAVRPGFVLTSENRAAVAELCVRLDGLPLALELAAARLKLSSPQALLTELEEDMGVLSGTQADTMSQHRTMSSAIEWSLARLRRAEQSFLGRLAVFTGEFGFVAAKGVGRTSAAETQDLLAALVDKNLLMAGERPDGEVSFRMLGLTRRYALEWLRQTGDYHQVMRNHTDYFMAMAKTAEAELSGPDQAWWLDQLGYWHEDVEAALRFLLDTGEWGAVASLAASLRLHWIVRGALREGARWLEASLELGEHPHHIAPKVHEVLGELAMWRGEMRVAEDRLGTARAMYEELRDSGGAAVSLRRLGRLAYHRGDLALADRLLEESVAALGSSDAARDHALALRDLAECRRARGNVPAAKKLAEAAMQEFGRQQDSRNIALTRYALADIAIGAGDLDEAEQLSRKALLLLHDLGDLPSTATGLETLAITMVTKHGRMTESWRRATRGLGAAAALRTRTGCVAPGPAREPIGKVTEEARVRLGDKVFEEAWAAGRELAPQTAIAESLAPVQSPPSGRLRGAGADNPLTQREMEVAELVACGMTNREIARRLGIAEWTAVNHLRKIMRKLDCSSRVHVAGWMTKMQGPPAQPGPRTTGREHRGR